MYALRCCLVREAAKISRTSSANDRPKNGAFATFVYLLIAYVYRSQLAHILKNNLKSTP